jgi:hypothetical protein
MVVTIEAAGDIIAFGQAARAFVCSSIQDQTIDFLKKIMQEINSLLLCLFHGTSTFMVFHII